MLGERDLKSKLFFVTVLVLQLLIVQGQESCTDAKSYFYGVLDLDSSLLSVRPTERADQPCNQSLTCCTEAAVRTLKDIAEKHNKGRIQKVVDSAANIVCSPEQYENALSAFKQVEKLAIHVEIEQALGSDHFSETVLLPFYNFIDAVGVYLQGNRSLCGAENLLPNLAVNFIWSLLKIGNADDSINKSCFRTYILSKYNDIINQVKGEVEGILLRVYHVIRYKTLLFKAVDSLMQEPWAAECKSGLMRLHYCDGCSGLHSNASQRTLCYSECSQVNSMCLKGYKALENITESWISMSDSIKYEFLGFNPDNLLRGLFHLYDLSSNIETIKSEVTNRCRSPRVKKQVVGHSAIVPDFKFITRDKRQSESSLIPHLHSQIDCATELAKGVRVSNLLSKICENATSTSGCAPDIYNSTQRAVFSPKTEEVLNKLKKERLFILTMLYQCNEPDCPSFREYPHPSSCSTTPTSSPEPSTTPPTTNNCAIGNVGDLDTETDDDMSFSGSGDGCPDTVDLQVPVTDDHSYIALLPYTTRPSSAISQTSGSTFTGLFFLAILLVAAL